MAIPHRFQSCIARADAAANQNGLPGALAELRKEMGLDEFTTVLRAPLAQYGNLRRELPTYPSPEDQRAWTGNSDDRLAQQTTLFFRTCQGLSQQHRGLPLQGARMLDYGCGWGRLTRQMLYFSDPAHVFAVDPWHKSLDLCREHNLPGTIMSVDYRPSSLPEEISDIDVTTAFSVFTHLGEDNVRDVLRCVRSVTVNGGLFIFTIRPFEYWRGRVPVLGEEVVADMIARHERDGYAFVPSGARKNAGSSEYGESSYSRERIEKLANETDWRLVATDWLLIDPFQIIVCLRA